AAPRAIDGNRASRWDTGAAQANGQWFQLDMHVPTTFDRIVLDAGTSRGDYPRGYRISVSDDGSSWVDVASGAGSGEIAEAAFASQTRRFVRITQTGSSGSWWSIHEIRVHAGGPPRPVPTPYLGTPVNLPGTVEAEDFDNGGSGVAYWDVTPSNQGGAYRPTEAVDLEGHAGRYNVGWIDTGEWLLYTVNVTEAGTYRARLRVASPHADGIGRVSLAIGGVASPAVGIPGTGSWSSFQETTIGGLSLAAGRQVMRVKSERAGWNLDAIVVEREPETEPGLPTPFLGAPVSLPGRVEAENFDKGGEGVSYSDVSPSNEGGVYRPAEAVDIEGSGGAYNVGWIDTGEWLAYTVSVSVPGTYRARLRVASPHTAGTGQVSLAFGEVTSAPVGIPRTGAWSSYQEITIDGLLLGAGVQTMRVNSVRFGWNLDAIVIEPSTAAAASGGQQ
ncbi:MAG: carbohydrate-binding protein, partial [Actinobacteria bacterium]